MSNFCNFVYDLHGNLRFILSPMYQDDSDIEKYAYEYRYDKHLRRVYSRRPGCEPVCYWYDKYNRLAFIQDGLLRKAGKCRFFLYDNRYRLAVQGVCKNTPADCMSTVVNYSGNGGICNSGYSYVSYYGGVELIPPRWRQSTTMIGTTSSTGRFSTYIIMIRSRVVELCRN